MSKVKGTSELDRLEKKLRQIESGKFVITTKELIKLQDRILKLRGV